MMKVLCQTPTGKRGVRIEQWKYDLVHDAILSIVPRDEQGIPFAELAPLVEKLLGDKATELGSVMWYTVTVKLDMEVRGEIERLPDAKPQRLRKII